MKTFKLCISVLITVCLITISCNPIHAKNLESENNNNNENVVMEDGFVIADETTIQYSDSQLIEARVTWQYLVSATKVIPAGTLSGSAVTLLTIFLSPFGVGFWGGTIITMLNLFGQALEKDMTVTLTQYISSTPQANGRYQYKNVVVAYYGGTLIFDDYYTFYPRETYKVIQYDEK